MQKQQNKTPFEQMIEARARKLESVSNFCYIFTAYILKWTY